MNILAVNPFEIYSEKRLTFFGVLLLVFASVAAFLLNARFDGILDMHLVREVRLVDPLLDNVINTLVLTFFLFVLGYFLNPKTRIWDVLNVALVARIPFYSLPMFNIGDLLNNRTDELLKMVDTTSGALHGELSTSSILLMLVFACFGIGALVVFGYLLFIGFRTATNSKSKKTIFLLIITVLLCEWISKMAINLFN
jgi:hypothetical protein